MNLLDRTIAWLNPEAGLKRAQQRKAIDVIRSYNGASHGRRMKDIKATGADANAEIERDLRTLRNRSRDMARNNVYGRRIIQTITVNTIGTGIIPTPDGLSRTAEKRIMSIWKRWAGKKRCDFDGLLTFAGIQKLVMRTVVMSGECLVIRRREEDTDVPLSLQVLEPDFIDMSKTLQRLGNGNTVMHGIEFNSRGKRVAYWLYSEHPGSSGMHPIESKRVLAEDVCHIYFVERPGQVRGVPWLATPFVRLKDYDDYEDAELVRQKIAACFTVFVSDLTGDAPVDEEEEDIASRVEPGIIEILPPGKQVSFAQPPTTSNYDGYSKKVLQGIASGVGITYEAMTGDLSNVNFSSGRMGWLEMHRNITDWQEEMIVPLLCDTVWDWFIDALAISGKSRRGIDVSWTPPRREMVDPVKETSALREQVRCGFISWQEAVRQLGYDPDDTTDEIVADFKSFDENKMILDSDGRYGKSKIALVNDLVSALSDKTTESDNE